MKYPSRTRSSVGRTVFRSEQELELDSRLVVSVILAMHVSAYATEAKGANVNANDNAKTNANAKTNGQNTLAENIALLDTAAQMRKTLQLSVPSNHLFNVADQVLQSIAAEEMAWLPISTKHKTDF